MSTSPVTVLPPGPAPAPKVSWLKKLGHDIAKGFGWAESQKGQAVIGSAEAITLAVFPPAAGIIALVNAWLKVGTTIEAKAVAAADLGVTATGAQKSVAAIAAVAPDVEAILAQYKLLPISAASMQIINDAVIAIAKEVVPAPETTNSAPPATTAP
jgi:hypothetical protein